MPAAYTVLAVPAQYGFALGLPSPKRCASLHRCLPSTERAQPGFQLSASALGFGPLS